MKYLLLLLFPVSVFGQGNRIIGNNILVTEVDSTLFTYSNFGYFKTGQKDTINAIFLITDDTCLSKSVKGYIIREQYRYYGDPMPPGNYSDQWRFFDYLDKNKKPFTKNVIIWQTKTQ